MVLGGHEKRKSDWDGRRGDGDKYGKKSKQSGRVDSDFEERRSSWAHVGLPDSDDEVENNQATSANTLNLTAIKVDDHHQVGSAPSGSSKGKILLMIALSMARPQVTAVGGR